MIQIPGPTGCRNTSTESCPNGSGTRSSRTSRAAPNAPLIVSDLRRVVRRARTLKNPSPATDLWPGIAARIGAGTSQGPRRGGSQRSRAKLGAAGRSPCLSLLRPALP